MSLGTQGNTDVDHLIIKAMSQEQPNGREAQGEAGGGGGGRARSIHALSGHAPQHSYEFTTPEALQIPSFRALYGGSIMQA